MSLPKANCSFVIPSIHDDLELDCRVYYPRRTEQNVRLFGRGFAIFAHPYAPLGGSYDDPVVGLAAGVLLQHGLFLVTFNFRGASGSAGRTSWSGKAELGDYVSVYGFMLCYMDGVFRGSVEPPGAGSSKDAPLLVLGGYSYGSMITSHLPPVQTVADLFKSPKLDSAQSEIKRRAEDLSRDGRAYLEIHTGGVTLLSPKVRAGRVEEAKSPRRSVTVGGYESDAASRRVSREFSRKSIDGDRVRQSIDRVHQKLSSRVQTPTAVEPETPRLGVSPTLPLIAYVLVSPLLSTVAGFTTMFSKLRYTGRDAGVAPHTDEEFHELMTHPCCCLYGSKDVFTSGRKLQRWTESLSAKSASQFMAIRVETGHFWQEAEAVIRLRQGLAQWLQSLALKEK